MLKFIAIFLVAFQIVCQAAYKPFITVNLAIGNAIDLASCSVTNIQLWNMAIGTTDIWTVPSGYRAFPNLFSNNNTNASITANFFFNTNGTYYRCGPSASIATNATGTWNTDKWPLILEAGEKFSISNSIAGLSLCGEILYYPNTRGPYSPRVMSVSAGNTTIYTVPTGKNAIILNNNATFVTSGSATHINSSGGTRTVYYYMVPNGSSPQEWNRFSPIAGTVADGAITTRNFPIALSAGDSIVVNSDAATATQIAFCTVLEY